MSNRRLWGLVLLLSATVVLLINRGTIALELLVIDLNVAKSLLLLAFLVTGIIVGVLLK